MTEPSDGELLTGLQTDSHAICVLYDRYSRPLLGALLRRGRDAELAFDVMQETFVRVLEDVRRVRVGSDGSAWPWLWTIARNLLTDAQRRGVVDRRASERLGYAMVPYDGEALDDILERLGAEALAEQLQAAMGSLSVEQHAAISGRVLEEQSYAELARTTGVGVAALRQRVTRGLRTVRVRLAGGKP